MATITWLGHATWLIESDGHRVLLDPFLNNNPVATKTPADFADVTHVLVSHGHFDHLGDTVEIAKLSGATVITNFEIANWLTTNHGIDEIVGMNIGGSTEISIGTVKFTPAVHSSGLPDGSDGGSPAGMLITLGQKRVYFACDTALFSDMRMYAHGVDLAVLPIGDLYTMGIDDSIRAIQLIEPDAVLPAHYNTMPMINQDADAWADRVRAETNATPTVLGVGETFEL